MNTIASAIPKSMRASRITLIAVSIFALLHASISRSEDVLGKMGSVEIKVTDVKRILSSRGIEAAPNSLSVDELDRLIRDELVRRTILNEARAKGWDKKPEILERMERGKEDALMSAYVSGVARPPADYPSDLEIKDAYDTNRSLFLLPKQYRIAQIFLATSGSDSIEKVQARAEELALKAADKNADFGRLASETSQHPESAARGGNLGWLSETQLIPEIRAVVKNMRNGGVSKPLQSSNGFHIIKLIDTKDASDRPIVEVRSQVVNSLRTSKAEANGKQYVNELLKRTPVNVNQVELAKIASPAK